MAEQANEPVEPNSPEGQRLRARLYDKLPLLIEVSFRGCETSSDWFVCSTDDQLDELLARLPADREIFAVCVDELKSERWMRLRL